MTRTTKTTTTLGENIEAVFDKDTKMLTLMIDTSVKGAPSSTGKTMLVASSSGWKEIPIIDGDWRFMLMVGTYQG